jgi:hypothetical protein
MLCANVIGIRVAASHVRRRMMPVCYAKVTTENELLASKERKSMLESIIEENPFVASISLESAQCLGACKNG